MAVLSSHAPFAHPPPPAPPQAKARVCSIVEELERTAPFRADAPGAAAALLGSWSLAFASSGTVVTRSPAAQALAQMAALPGFGISDIGQQLEDPAAGRLSGVGPGGAGKTPPRGERFTVAGAGWAGFASGFSRPARSTAPPNHPTTPGLSALGPPQATSPRVPWARACAAATRCSSTSAPSAAGRFA